MALTDFLGSAAGISSGTGLLGAGISAVGGAVSLGYSEQAAGYQSAAYQQSGNIAALEQQMNAQRQQQMELTSQRTQMQTLRTQQRARSMALASAASQGAQFGSGVKGGYGGISGQTGTNILSTGQNLQIGQNIFGLQAGVSGAQIEMSNDLSGAATAMGNAGLWSGIGSLGTGIMGAANPLGKIFAQT